MCQNIEIPIVVSTCDAYEDAWNPLFRLLEKNWKNAPRKVYLITETKEYVDSYFDVICIHSNKKMWSDRIISALEHIKEAHFWFFLEDFFLESEVNEEIVYSAIDLIKDDDNNVGVIKFIPRITSSWYDATSSFNDYFCSIPKEYKARSNLMLSLYKNTYFKKMLRRKETPWDFEKFGTFRSRKFDELVLVQNNMFPLAFDYNYEIRFGMGITKRKWLKNNKLLFERYGIDVNFDRLGWYEDTENRIVGLGRTKKEKLLMPFLNPKMFFRILKHQIKPKWYILTHLRHYF